MSETDIEQGDAANEAPLPDMPSPETGQDMSFAYHDGPRDIIFAGRNWRRGVPQPVTPDELHSMTRRAGWVVFDFRQT
ncbi:MAG: hypothetical protein ABIK08_11410 [Pseudomonadota bacterium]